MDISAQQFWSSKLKVESTTDIEDGIEQVLITNVDRNDTLTTFNGVTTGSSQPSGAKSLTAGEHWHATGALSGAPDERDLVYSAAAATWVGPSSSIFATTAPASTQTGLQWYDTTCKVKRIYKKAADDASGLAGWHSAQDGYELWKNLTGGTATPGMVVTADATVSFREYIKPQGVKDWNVVGVVAETVTSTSNGLIATVAGGATVLINVSTATHTVAVGDGLVCHAATDTDARSVGSIDGKNPKATAGQSAYGVPYGCFAQAMEAVALGTAGAPIKARMLGAVGDGRTLRFAQDELATDATIIASGNWDGLWDDINLEVAENGGNILADNGSAKHGPVLGAYLDMWLVIEATANPSLNTADMQFGPNASAVTARMRIRDEKFGIGGEASAALSGVFVPTAGGSGNYDKLGNIVTWSGTYAASAGTKSIDAAALHVTGYVY